MKGCYKHGNHIGVFLALIFILCFVKYWIHPVQQEFHLQSLESAFFGFTGMNTSSFFLGLIQSYVYGYIFAGLWCLAGCLTGCCKKKS